MKKFMYGYTDTQMTRSLWQQYLWTSAIAYWRLDIQFCFAKIYMQKTREAFSQSLFVLKGLFVFYRFFQINAWLIEGKRA